jgi:uncharacterized phage protein (predicted DNA packaging)
MYITLEEVKKHINVDNDYHEDDIYITSLIEVCEDAVQRHICNTFVNLLDTDNNLPSALKHAILLLIATYYANRETIAFASANEIPLSYSYLLDLFKKYN